MQMSCYSVLCGNKLLTLRPNLHEQLEEVQVVDLTLPEDIERLRAAKKRDTEQVGRLGRGNGARGVLEADSVHGRRQVSRGCG
jgi:hypothetical protein